MDNEQIVRLFFERDENAVKALSEHCGAAMKAVSVSVLHNELDAEECVNDALLQLWNKIPPEKPVNIRAYACEVVRNISMQRYRYNTAEKRRAEVVSIDNELSDIIADKTPVDNGLSESLDRFLKSLSKKNRILFMRRYYYEDSISKIAEISDMKENAVAARLFRIRKKLMEHLIKEGFKI